MGHILPRAAFMTRTGLKPIVIAETKRIYMVEFTANDGGVILVTCSTPDQIVLVTATRAE